MEKPSVGIEHPDRKRLAYKSQEKRLYLCGKNQRTRNLSGPIELDRMQAQGLIEKTGLGAQSRPVFIACQAGRLTDTMASDFYAARQQDFVSIKLNLNPEGNTLWEYIKDKPCALVWFQTFNAARPEKHTKHFRLVHNGRVTPGEPDWKAPGVLVTPIEALALCRQYPEHLGMAIALSQGNNLSMLDIDATTENASEYTRHFATNYCEPTSNGGWHYLLIGRLGRNMTKPVEFYSGDHLCTVSFMGSGPIQPNYDALEYFDSISIQYDFTLFEPVLVHDNRSVNDILTAVQTYEPDKFKQLYMTLHQPSSVPTEVYNASAMDMALIMSIMDYTRDIDLVRQVFLVTGFGQRLINRQPTDKKKGKNYLNRSILKALPRQSEFWIAQDFRAQNYALFNDPDFWPSAYGKIIPAPEAETKPIDIVTISRAAVDRPLYPELPRGGMFDIIQETMYHGYNVENWHFAKMHALDTVNTLLMPFYVFNARTRSNMYKVITGPTSAGKGMILQSADYMRMVNEIADETLRGHKQPFIDISTSPIRQRYVTGPMQGSVRGLDKLYEKAVTKRPVIAIKENDFTQSLEAFFADLATATGPSRNLAELGDECTDLFDKSRPGGHLETKATGKTDAIIIAEPMVDITFEGTQEPLLTSIAPDGSNLASGRVNRWIFFINDEYYATRQKKLAEMRDLNIGKVVKEYLTPIILRLVEATDNCVNPLNALMTNDVSEWEWQTYERVSIDRKVLDLSQGARDAYARIRVNAQKMAMLFAMERHASYGGDFALRRDDFELAYQFILPGYDYLSTNFSAGNVGAVDDHDYILNGSELIRAELKRFYKSSAYDEWLKNFPEERANRYRALGIVPFRPVREKVWTHPIFTTRRIRANKPAAMNACLDHLEAREIVLVDRGTSEKNVQHQQLCAANGMRATGEGLTNAVLVRVFR